MSAEKYHTFYELIQKRSALINPAAHTEIDLSEIPAPINWQALFGNDHPVEMEIGCGKGKYLLEASQQCPEINFIGVERGRKYIERARVRLERWVAETARDSSAPLRRCRASVSNVRLIWSDAAYFVGRYIPEASVSAYHVYFPDPWPKKRHNRRRLFRNEIWLESLRRTLKPNEGRIHIATDHAEYFYEIHYTLSHMPPLVYVPSLTPDTPRILTSFEMKYRAEGRKIYRAVYQMKGG